MKGRLAIILATSLTLGACASALPLPEKHGAMCLRKALLDSGLAATAVIDGHTIRFKYIRTSGAATVEELALGIDEKNSKVTYSDTLAFPDFVHVDDILAARCPDTEGIIVVG